MEFDNSQLSSSIQRKYALVTDGSSKIPIMKSYAGRCTPSPLDHGSPSDPSNSATKHKIPVSISSRRSLLHQGHSNVPSPRTLGSPSVRASITSHASPSDGESTPQRQIQSNNATPPSTMTKLSNSFADLAIRSPVKPTPKCSSPQPKETPMLTSKPLEVVKRRTLQTSQRGKSPRKVSQRISSNNNTPSKSPSKGQADEPVFSRLTRSTTAFNLKINNKPRVVSEIHSPKPQLHHLNDRRSQRVVSERPDLTRPTRASQLKSDTSTMNLRVSSTKHDGDKIAVDKKRSIIPKSISLHSSLKDLTNSSISQRKSSRDPVIRKLSGFRMSTATNNHHMRKISSSKRAATRCTTTDELYSLLKSYHKTSKFVEQWNETPLVEVSEPQESQQVLNRYKNLNAFEMAEVGKQEMIYYVGNIGREYSSSNVNSNFGFDNKDKNLIISKNDHIAYRYQVLSKLGTGAFGNVYRCYDHKMNKMVSLKIMRNDPAWSLQSMYEIKILRRLHEEPRHLLQYLGHLNFRSHICVSTELLSVNLIEALGATKYQGFELSVIKLWSQQLLSALEFLHRSDIVHADLKPENIMLQSPNSFNLKIIDFGSSTTVGDITYPYIQSRFYRAPEVLLGARYDTKIDIWSFATVMYEMYTGKVMFEAKNETHLYKLFVELLGNPPPRTVLSMRETVLKNGSVNKYNDGNFVDKSTLLFTSFSKVGVYRGEPVDTSKCVTPFHKRLNLGDLQFADFIQTILVWNPKERPSAKKLLQHRFLEEQ